MGQKRVREGAGRVGGGYKLLRYLKQDKEKKNREGGGNMLV